MITAIFFAIIITIAVIVSIVFFVYYKKLEISSENNPIVWNFDYAHSNGRTTGTLLKMYTKNVKGNRKIVYFIPGDVNRKKYNPNEVVRIITEEDKLLIFPKGGTFSMDRDIIIILPHLAEHFPPAIKNDPRFKSLLSSVENQNVNNHILDVMKEKYERQRELAEAISGGELSDEYIKKTEDFISNLLDVQSKLKEKDKPKPEYMNVR